MHPKITESFNEMAVNTDAIGAENVAVTERFYVILYDRTTKLGNIIGVRRDRFTRKQTSAHETLPPTTCSNRRLYQTSSVSRWPCMGPIHVSPNETTQP